MTVTHRIARHADLFGRMAGALGVDPGGAVAAQRLQPQALRGAVFRCMGCAGAGQCPGWLDAHSDDCTEPPDFCANHDLLTGLQAPEPR